MSEFDGDTVLCRVCGDKASGFHYGVHACEGCKGFFRRSIQQKIQYRPCLKNQQCNIMRVNRNRCQYCRLKKCIAVGMSRDAVRFGRVPKKEKAKIMEQMQKVNTQSQVNMLGTVLENKADVIQKVIEAHLEMCEFTRAKVRAFVEKVWRNPQFVNCPAHMACPLNPSPENADGAKRWEEFSECFTPAIRNVVNFAKCIPGFQLLSQEDQVTLLKAGTFEVLLVHLASLFDAQTNTMIFTNGKMYKRVSLTVTNSAGFLLDSMFDFAERLNALQLTDEETALFSAIVIIAADRPGVRNVEQVERVQNHITQGLQAMMQVNHPEDPAIFAKLLMKIPDLRTLNTLHSEKLLGLTVPSAGRNGHSASDKLKMPGHEAMEPYFHSGMVPPGFPMFGAPVVPPSHHDSNLPYHSRPPEVPAIVPQQVSMETSQHGHVVLQTPLGTFHRQSSMLPGGMEMKGACRDFDKPENVIDARRHPRSSGGHKVMPPDIQKSHHASRQEVSGDSLDSSNGTPVSSPALSFTNSISSSPEPLDVELFASTSGSTQASGLPMLGAAGTKQTTATTSHASRPNVITEVSQSDLSRKRPSVDHGSCPVKIHKSSNATPVARSCVTTASGIEMSVATSSAGMMPFARNGYMPPGYPYFPREAMCHPLHMNPAMMAPMRYPEKPQSRETNHRHQTQSSNSEAPSHPSKSPGFQNISSIHLPNLKNALMTPPLAQPAWFLSQRLDSLESRPADSTKPAENGDQFSEGCSSKCSSPTDDLYSLHKKLKLKRRPSNEASGSERNTPEESPKNQPDNHHPESRETHVSPGGMSEKDLSQLKMPPTTGAPMGPLGSTTSSRLGHDGLWERTKSLSDKLSYPLSLSSAAEARKGNHQVVAAPKQGSLPVSQHEAPPSEDKHQYTLTMYETQKDRSGPPADNHIKSHTFQKPHENALSHLKDKLIKRIDSRENLHQVHEGKESTPSAQHMHKTQESSKTDKNGGGSSLPSQLTNGMCGPIPYGATVPPHPAYLPMTFPAVHPALLYQYNQYAAVQQLAQFQQLQMVQAQAAHAAHTAQLRLQHEEKGGDDLTLTGHSKSGGSKDGVLNLSSAPSNQPPVLVKAEPV